MAGVEHVPGVVLNRGEIEGVVIDQQHHGVGGGDLVGRCLHPVHWDVDSTIAHVRVRGPDLGAQGEEALGHDQGRRLPGVTSVALVGQPEEQDPAAV